MHCDHANEHIQNAIHFVHAHPKIETDTIENDSFLFSKFILIEMDEIEYFILSGYDLDWIFLLVHHL